MTEIRDNDNMLERLRALEQVVKSAFPEGDPEGHRKFHEALLETQQWYKHLRRTVTEKIIVGISFFIAGWLATILWEYLKYQVVK